MAQILKLLVIYLLLSACKPEIPTGQLLVRAPDSGSFEIYRMAGESPLQFVSEEIGYFNQPIDLAIGSYLILADCSHEVVNISAGESKDLVSHRVNFVTPIEKDASDKFSIQCNRFTKTKSIQHLQNRFALNVLHGNRDLLVGMVPLNIDFETMENPNEPKTLHFDLSAIRLSSYEDMKPKTLFFVSPANNLISVTENQEFGHWLFLLPGEYLVEVNGTSLKVALEKHQSFTIDPAFIRVSTSDTINLEISSNILGTPLYVELNDQHWLDLNETYPVLPGKALIKLNGSFRSQEVELVANQMLDKSVRSIQVNLDCPPWDWDCLGRRKVYLYEGDQLYPFAEGLTDVPILFFEKDVWIGIEGSRDIRHYLSDKRDHFVLDVANVKLIPQHTYRPNQITDLVRIEAIGAPFKGASLDLPLDREIVVPLIEGKFYLSQYTSSYSQEYERRSIRRILTLRQKTLPEIKYTVYVSEKKLKKLQKKRTAQKKTSKKKDRIEAAVTKPIIPFEIL